MRFMQTYHRPVIEEDYPQFMGGLEDTPILKKKWYQIIRWPWSGLLPILLLSPLAWGGVYEQVGEYKGLVISVQPIGETGISASGETLFGERLGLRIKVYNTTNQDFNDMSLQVSLHSDGGECDGRRYYPGAPLPGNFRSPEFNQSINAGSTMEYEMIYHLEDEDYQACSPHITNQTKVRIGRANENQFTSLISPAHFQFK